MHATTSELSTEDHEALVEFVFAASSEEIVERLARTEIRLQELDERLRLVKHLVDEAHL